MMKKTLLSLAIAVLGLGFTANAQIAIEGTYDGKIEYQITSMEADPQSQSGEKVILTKEEGVNLYTLKIEDFVLKADNPADNMPIGTIELKGVLATEDADGVVTLSKDVLSDGPMVYGTMTTEIAVNISTISNEILDVDLTVEVKELAMTISVKFTGTLFTASLIKGKAESLSVFPTVVGGDMGITVGGSDSESYAVYAQSGALVKSGKLNAGTFNLSGLPQGVYILSIEGKTAKLVKK